MSSNIKTMFARYSRHHYLIANKLKKWAWVIIRTGLIAGVSYIILYPIFVKIMVSLMTKPDLHDMTVKYVPKHFTLDNISVLLKNIDFLGSLLNTVLMTSMTTLLQITSCTLAAYGFARFRFKGRGLIFALVILTLIVPPQTTMVSTYMQFRFFDILGIIHLITGQRGVNIMGSLAPFILLSATCMGIRSGLFIYILRQVFRNLSTEIEESAWIDGASVFKTFYSIMLPNAVPAMVTVILFSIVWQWNDSFYTMLFMPEADTLTMALVNLPGKINAALAGINGFAAQYQDYIYVSMLSNAGALLIMSPLVLIYIFAQRYFVESIERAGVVG